MKQIFFVAACIICSPLLAQQTVSDSAQLDDVTVTASKYPRKQSVTGKPVTIVTREELERSKGRTLTELLNRQPGITIVGANNSAGTNQDVYLRGAGVGRTLILIDGIPAYDPSSITTAFDLNTIAIDRVERIEIVKGALSTLYGSDAVAGVINIITKKSGPRALQGFATVATGSSTTHREAYAHPNSMDAAKVAAGINGRAAAFDYGAGYSLTSTGRPSAAYDSTRASIFDEDGMTQHAWNAHAAITPLQGMRIEAYGDHSRYHASLDAGAFRDDRDYTVTVTNSQTGLRGKWQKGSTLLQLNYQYSVLGRNYLDDSVSRGGFSYYSRSKYKGRMHFVEGFTNIKAARHIDVFAGADYRFYNTDQEALYVSMFGPYKTALSADSAKAGQASVFTSLLLHDLRGFTFESGARANFHSSYGSNITYSLNPSYLIKEQVKLFVNYATGFKAPSPYQLFDAFAGNAGLQPETSATLEGGATLLPVKGFTAQGTWFNRTVQHGIDYNFSTNKYFNYNKQEDHGYELEAGYATPRFSFRNAFSHVTGKVSMRNFVYNPSTFSYEIKGDTSFNNLFRRPANTFSTTVGGKPLKALYIGATYKWMDERMEPVFGGAPVTLDGYHTVDVYADYLLKDAIRFFIDAKNVLGATYFDVRGYNTKRFNFMAGVHVSF